MGSLLAFVSCGKSAGGCRGLEAQRLLTRLSWHRRARSASGSAPRFACSPDPLPAAEVAGGHFPPQAPTAARDCREGSAVPGLYRAPVSLCRQVQGGCG